MSYKDIDKIVIEGAHLIFKNFSGQKSQYNREGNRNFCVLIDDEDMVNKLVDDGWNIRILTPKDPDEKPKNYMTVAVSYSNIPPKIYLVTRHKKTLLNDDTIESLDYAEIKNVDLVIRPYCWEIQDKDGTKSGVKAYVETMYVTIEEDRFADKYADEESPEDEEVPFN